MNFDELTRNIQNSFWDEYYRQLDKQIINKALEADNEQNKKYSNEET